MISCIGPHWYLMFIVQCFISKSPNYFQFLWSVMMQLWLNSPPANFPGSPADVTAAGKQLSWPKVNITTWLNYAIFRIKELIGKKSFVLWNHLSCFNTCESVYTSQNLVCVISLNFCWSHPLKPLLSKNFRR